MAYKSPLIQSYLSSAFRILGLSIGRHPFIYFFTPIIFTALSSVGFYRVNLVKNIEYLYSPVNGRALKERDALYSLFPLSNESMDITSATSLKGMATVLMVPKDNSTVLRESIIKDALNVDKIIYNITISWKNRTLTLRDLCLKTIYGDCQPNDVLNLRGIIQDIRKKRLRIRDLCLKTIYGDCQPNDVLNLRGIIQDIRKKRLRIRYPVNIERTSQRFSLYGMGLGGVTLDSNNYVVDALALRLFYLLDVTTPEKSEMSLRWEESFLEVIPRILLQNVRIVRGSSLAMDKEVNRLTEMSVSLFTIVVPLLAMYTVISTMTSNCITSKPWVAIASCISPMLGVISAFGMLSLFGVQYLDINIGILFLLCGIGLDDSFVMLAGWRRTDSKLKAEERMSQTYSETAVSITITSLTNCLSLCIGMATPFRVAQLYCAYAALSIFLAYIYQITFFGGTLALSGIREEKELHSILCFNAKNKNIGGSSTLNLFCFGCTNNNQDSTQEKPFATSVCVEFLLSILLTVKGKVISIGCFILYIASSSYFLSYMKEEFRFEQVVPYQSYNFDYLDVYYKHFRKYDDIIHLVINETLDYSSRNVQDDIDEFLGRFSEGPLMAGRSMCYSWLDYYLQTVNDKRLWLSYYGYNLSDTDDFVSALRDVFLNFHSGRHLKQHIKFNENKTKIISSRFILFAKDVDSSSKEKKLLLTLWDQADSSIYSVYVHSLWFPIFNMYVEIKSSFTNTLLTVIVLVTAIFFIIVPNIFCAICILLTVLSIQCGVIGYMFLWNIAISPISMLCVIMSVGLSIDYGAHISYSYLSSNKSNPDEKTKVALHSAGYPIIQGCISTLLIAIVLYFGPSEVFIVFSKVIILVMLISLFHGLIIIPVAFNILDTIWDRMFSRIKK